MTRAAPARPALVAQIVATIRARGLDRDAALASIAHAVAARVAPGQDLCRAGPLLDGSVERDESVCAAVPDDLATPQLLGDVLEQLHDRDRRRRQGAFFTPHDTAGVVVERATEGWQWPERPRVCDPACGGGVFLLAAARTLVARGLRPSTIVSDLLWGIDADRVAVDATRAALALWSAAAGDLGFTDHVVVADALVCSLEVFGPAAAPFDLVIGNPPFQSQLAATTARTREQARLIEARFGAVSRAYADSSTLFMVAAASMTRPGGRCALILPESFMAARDAAPARRELLDRGRLVGLWIADEPLFSTSVRVCVPVFEVGAGADGVVHRWLGKDAERAPAFELHRAALDASWAELTADLLGVPIVDVPDERRLESMARATAGFRDQFYGLRPFVREETEGDVDPVRLVTSGTIDLVNDLGPRRRTTFAGATYTRPVVELDSLEEQAPELAKWAARVLVPKVMVATQTRIVEVLVDESGRAWPSVPVIAVIAEPAQLWRVAAVLASPPVSALSLRRHGGAALTRDAIKLSAKQVLALPLPSDEAAWADGASHLAAAATCAAAGDGDGWTVALQRFGRSMCTAYGTDDDVLDWWIDRLPSFR